MPQYDVLSQLLAGQSRPPQEPIQNPLIDALQAQSRVLPTKAYMAYPSEHEGRELDFLQRDPGRRNSLANPLPSVIVNWLGNKIKDIEEKQAEENASGGLSRARTFISGL